MTGYGNRIQQAVAAAIEQMRGRIHSSRAAGTFASGIRRRRRAARFVGDESGQALIFAALSMTVVIGAMAMAIDIGNLHYQQRIVQTAANSAALAAGLELGNCSQSICTNMTNAAAQALIEDGFTTSTISPTSNKCAIPTVSSATPVAMGINVSPCILGSKTADPNYGNKYMAEVVVVRRVKTFFGGYLGFGAVTIAARAEAGQAYINNKTTSGGGNCIWTGGITFNSSNGDFNLTSCGVYDNGNLTTNSGDSATATDFQYYGTWSPNNCNSSCKWTLGQGETQPTSTKVQQTDPLASLSAPSQPAPTSSPNWGTPNNGVTLSPGYFNGTMNLNSNVTVNLTPGLYYMNGSINVGSGATLECTTCTGGAGVTLYFANGSLQPNSGSTVELSAPATGNASSGSAVANMLIWTASGNGSGLILDAGSSSYYNGIIYLPSGQLTLNSGSGTNINATATATAVDVQSMMIDSGITFNLNGSQGLLGGSSSQTTQSLGAFALAE